MKKVSLCVLVVILILGSACAFSIDSFGYRLLKLECVDSVEVLEQESPIFKEKYLVTFIQPIDWNDKSKGTFKQRVEIGIQGSDNINEYSVSGYMLYDELFPKDDRDEICRNYNGNSIKIEYRYFGKSVPKGLSNDDTALWEYLTVENAAKDFYFIMEQLSTILTGKKVFSGASKGGYTTNTMAYYYPESFDAFVSYVAPLCNGTEDPEIIKNVYETIGDNGYTKEIAASMRNIMLDFQIFCLKFRNEMQEAYYRNAIESGCKFRKNISKEIIWDVTLLDFACTYWQYGYDFEKLDKILKKPEVTEYDMSMKIAEAFNMVFSCCPPDGWSTNSVYFPYYWQAEVEMGNYGYNFSYLRNAAKDKTGNDLIYVKENEEKGLFKRLMFTEEQQKVLRYDNSLRNALITWSETTEANVIMIYGGCDIWYAVRIPECDNQNIHIFVQDNGCHFATISTLEENDKTECLSLLDNWLLGN